MAKMALSFFIVVILITACCSQDVRRPPSITVGPEKYELFAIDAKVELPCEASGTPSPEYEWYKGNKRLDLNAHTNIKQNPDTGSLVIEPAYAQDEGEYQCRAWNDYGLALSNRLQLVRATLAQDSSPPDKDYPVLKGESLVIECITRKSVPAAKYNWETAESRDATQSRAVTLDRRVNMDENGNLYFSYIKREDAKNGYVYKCNTINSKLDITIGGSYSTITVTESPAPDVKPKVLHRTGNGADVIGIAGEELVLRCLFGGKPEVAITWRRSRSNNLPSHINEQNHGTELLFKGVRKPQDGDLGDEDTYHCKGCNDMGCVEQSIMMVVEIRPAFLDTADAPRDVNITEGQEVKMRCDAESEPAAANNWMINGESFEDVQPGSRYSVSGDRKTLTIKDVCKDCTSGRSDLQVIQCDASNDHGYAFGGGYINVLLATKIPDEWAPNDAEMVYQEGANVTLECKATSDDSTPISYDWLHEVSKNENERFEYISGVRYKDADNSLVIITRDEEAAKYAGKYTCVADNGYSTARAVAYVKLPGGALPVVQSGFEAWWIVVVIAGALLLLILVLCCCLYCRRNKGDAYKVDEIERKHGLNPEKEVAESELQDYQRPAGEPTKGSRASLASSIKLASDDGGSLAEYGDLETAKFGEDGSFIGQYAADKTK